MLAVCLPQFSVYVYLHNSLCLPANVIIIKTVLSQGSRTFAQLQMPMLFYVLALHCLLFSHIVNPCVSCLYTFHRFVHCEAHLHTILNVLCPSGGCQEYPETETRYVGARTHTSIQHGVVLLHISKYIQKLC